MYIVGVCIYIYIYMQTCTIGVHVSVTLNPLQHPRLAAKLRKRLDVESRAPQELEPRRSRDEETDLGEGPESDGLLTKNPSF